MSSTYRRSATAVSPWIDFDLDLDTYTIHGEAYFDPRPLGDGYVWLHEKLAGFSQKRRLAILDIDLKNVRSDSLHSINRIAQKLCEKYDKVTLARPVIPHASVLSDTLDLLKITYEGPDHSTR